MPSLTHPTQQSTVNTINNKPSSSQHQVQLSSSSNVVNPTGRTPSNETASTDPITQALLLFEKKQRNLGKRKEKLESYEQEAKKGKELNKDQLDALSKYGEVIGQIECIKDIAEQFKKIQIETGKSQKRQQKQAAEEKRLLVNQRLRDFAQLRYLIDNRPTNLNEEETALLDELSQLMIPAELSSISRSIDTVLAIYHSHTTKLKHLNDRNSQEVKQQIEDLFKHYQQSTSDDHSTDLQAGLVKETPVTPHPPPTTPASIIAPKEQIQPTQTHTDVLIPSLSHTPVSSSSQPTFNNLPPANTTEYPLQFDTRNQNVPLQEILRDNTFFPIEINNQQDLNKEHQNDSQQYSQTLTIVNSNISNPLVSQPYQDSNIIVNEQKLDQTYEQENPPSMATNAHVAFDDEQQHLHHQQQQQQQQQTQNEEQWQQRRANSGNSHRSGQHHNGNRAPYRGSPNNYHHQQQWRGSSRGNSHGHHADGSYNQGGQRQYHDNNNNQRNGHAQQRPGSNTNYRGNRGNSGHFRGGNRQNPVNQNQN